MANLHSQKIVGPEDAGAVGISDKIFHVVGADATVLIRPAGLRANMVTLMAVKGNFLVRLGALTSGDFYAGLYPTVSDLTQGNGAILIPRFGSLVLPAPEKITVRGDVSDSVLTFFWL